MEYLHRAKSILTYFSPGIYSVTLNAYNTYGKDGIMHTVEAQEDPVLYRNFLPFMTK